MIAPSDIQEYRKQCLHRRKRANTVKGDATVREMKQVLEFYKDRLPG